MFAPAPPAGVFVYLTFFYMKNLIICGKANLEKSADEIRTRNSELWMLGTDPRKGADKYFELHGIRVDHENTIYELPDSVYEQGLPVNNSISALLIYAFLSGYKKISLVGCPMNSVQEYIEERPALAFVVGYFAGLGLRLEWDGMPENKSYGFKQKSQSLKGGKEDGTE